MTDYVSCYDPPLIAEPISVHRERAFTNEDQEMYLHVGHFIAWYAAVEFGITMLLLKFSGGIHATPFHILSRGMDAKLKIERLKENMKAVGWTCEPDLAKRFQHFSKMHVRIRNQLVHSHLYWPAGGDLQMTSIGNPPLYQSTPLDAPAPNMIPGLELYERGVWLNLFAQDVIAIANSVPKPLKREGILGRDHYLSNLPTGDRPSPETQARRAKTGKPAQKPRSEQR